MEISYKLTGATEAAAALRQLTPELQRTVLLQALRKVATPIRDQISANAPRLTGALAANIVIETIKPTEGGSHALAIGPDRKRFYGLFSEYGTRKQRARPWMRPVVDESVWPATHQFGLIVWERLVAIAKRLAKGQ